uniref:Uncharacterized protein n=1 Tax=Romanomermis culicivorax TaxID=13658 RepID=A0A915KXU9_ROMCU
MKLKAQNFTYHEEKLIVHRRTENRKSYETYKYKRKDREGFHAGLRPTKKRLRDGAAPSLDGLPPIFKNAFDVKFSSTFAKILDKELAKGEKLIKLNKRMK